MHAAPVRAGVVLTDIRPPRKLAPYSHAVGFEVDRAAAAGENGGEAVLPDPDAVPVDGEGDAFGRLILLHDPRGEEGPGVMRLVAYIQADQDPTTEGDPLLPEVAWDWLTEELTGSPGLYTDLGGTVTSTTSVRYGDIAGPPRAFQLELRASWTATGTDLSGHVTAFAHVLAKSAGLPPEGVASFRRRSRQ
jgi:hypothetical protein